MAIEPQITWWVHPFMSIGPFYTNPAILLPLNLLKRFLRQTCFAEHLELHRLDCLSSHGDLTNWEFCRQKLQELPSEVIRPPGLLTGRDLIQFGYSPSPIFKEILIAVEDAQLEGRIRTREEAIVLVEKQFPHEP